MDILTVLIEAAAVVGNAAANESAKRAVASAWDTAVGAVKRCFGSDHPAPRMIETLPDVVDKPLQIAEIRSQCGALHLQWDEQVTAAVERLAEALKAQAHLGASYNVSAHTISGVGLVHNSTVTIHNGSK